MMLRVLFRFRHDFARWLMCWAMIIPVLPAGPAHAASVPGAPPPDCSASRDLIVVAHQDDDLLFMNPDIADTIALGGCVRVVYLTASDRGEGEGYMAGRERGVQAAYAHIAQAPDHWVATTIVVNHYDIAQFSLAARPRLELWHLRLKDPWLGPGWGSLTPLSQAEAFDGKTAETLGPKTQTYTRTTLVKTLADIIRSYQPTTVRYLDDTISVPYTQLCWRCAGHSHPDHIASAKLVQDALRAVSGNRAAVGYLDYPSQERAANLGGLEIAGKTRAFQHYAWHDYRYCAGPQGCKEPLGPAALWVQRTYYTDNNTSPPALAASDLSAEAVALAATGEDNDAVNLWDSTRGTWRSLGGRVGDPATIFHDTGNRPGIMARDALGRVWVTELAPQAARAQWQPLRGARVIATPAVVSSGGVSAIGFGLDQRLYWTSKEAAHQEWPAWQPLPDLPAVQNELAIAADARNEPVAFAQDQRGQLFVIYLPVRQGNAAWTRLPAPPSRGGLAAIRNGQGRLELYFRESRTGQLHRLRQQTTDQLLSWSTAENLGVRFSGRPGLASAPDGTTVTGVLESTSHRLWLLHNGRAVTTKTAPALASGPSMLARAGRVYAAARIQGQEQRYALFAYDGSGWRLDITTPAPPASGGSPFDMAAR